MPISDLVKRAIQLNQGRFKAHRIVISCPLLQGEEEDFKASGAFNFYLQVLMNLIDNSIYWVRKRAELEKSGFQRAIQIRSLPDWAAEGPGLAVLDNGQGFSISPDEAMRPYASTRPGGMGLGLFFARTAMDANGGDLLIPSSIDDLDIETSLDGGAVVMRFRRVR
jgi:nitrogen fixation/metabolism regulation signal transduction histidine kinase